MTSTTLAIEAIRGGRYAQSHDYAHALVSSKAAANIILQSGFGPLQDVVAGREVAGFDVLVADQIVAPNHKIGKMASLPAVMLNLVTPNYLLHFETCNDWLHSMGRGDSSTWPAVLEFARIVRNAISHGGKLEIHNPKARVVTWGGVTYGPGENKQIIGADLFLADLVALMLEVDDELVVLGCPR